MNIAQKYSLWRAGNTSEEFLVGFLVQYLKAFQYAWPCVLLHVFHLQALSFYSLSFSSLEDLETLRRKVQQKSALCGGKAMSRTEGICSVDLLQKFPFHNIEMIVLPPSSLNRPLYLVPSPIAV